MLRGVARYVRATRSGGVSRYALGNALRVALRQGRGLRVALRVARYPGVMRYA